MKCLFWVLTHFFMTFELSEVVCIETNLDRRTYCKGKLILCWELKIKVHLELGLYTSGFYDDNNGQWFCLQLWRISCFNLVWIFALGNANNQSGQGNLLCSLFYYILPWSWQWLVWPSYQFVFVIGHRHLDCISFPFLLAFLLSCFIF